MPAVDVVGAVPDEHGLFFRHIQSFHHMQQHTRFRFQSKPAIASDDTLEMMRPQSIENHIRILDRFVGRHRLALSLEVDKCLFDTGIERRAIEAMGQVLAPEHPQRLVEGDPTILTDRQTQQLFHPISHKPKDFLDRPLRQSQLGQCQVHRRGDVPFGLDERPIQIEDQQLDRGLSHHYFAFRNSSCNAPRLSRFAGSVSFTQDSRTKFTIRCCPT